jgi:hypothetical protein
MHSMLSRSCGMAEHHPPCWHARYLIINDFPFRVGFCPHSCPNRRGIYDCRKPCQQWLSHFSEDRQLVQELIIGQIIQRLRLETNILGQNPSNYTYINVRLLGATFRNWRVRVDRPV